MALPGNVSNHPAFQDTLYVTVYSLLFPVGLLANSLALWVFWQGLRPLNSGATVYMTCLAATDLLFVLSLPFRIAYHARRQWTFGEAMCKVTSALFYSNLYGSVLFLTCICADRYLAIAHPLRFLRLRTPAVARIVAAGVWVTVALGTVPIYLLEDTTNDKRGKGGGETLSKKTCFQGFSESDWEKLSAVVLAVELAGFVIPLAVMGLCSCGIVAALRRVRRHRRQFLHVAKAARPGSPGAGPPGSPGAGNDTDGDLDKVGRLVLSTLAIFVVCFAPYHIEMVLYTLLRRQVLAGWGQLKQVVRLAQPITLCLASSNCVMDPLVYYYRARAFRRALRSWSGWRRWCRWWRHRWPASAEDARNSSSEPAVMMLRPSA